MRAPLPLLALVSVLTAADLTAQARWQPLAAPPGRAAHAMAFDLANSEVVLHGGALPAAVPPQRLGDTWTYGATGWAPGPGGGPGLRSGHALAFDANRQRVVLFGGFDGSALRDDTWEWDGLAWTRVTTAVAPSARSEHAMAYDFTRQRLVLFGGADASGTLQDTWEWDGFSWSQVNAGGLAPPPLRRHAMAGDLSRAAVVLFGGTGPGGPSAATWTWNGSTWTQLATPTTPPALDGQALAFDIGRQRVVLFGGMAAAPFPSGSPLSDETWELGPNDWQRVATPTTPPRRTGAAMAYDVARGRTVMFGGSELGAALADCWEYDGNDWQPRGGSPLGRSGHAMATAANGSGALIFGGWDGIRSFLGDTWVHDGVDWREAGAGALAPRPRRYHAMARDPLRGRVVLFGGFDGASRLADTWEWDGRGWRRIATPTVPPARDGHAMAWDPSLRRILMFGGSDGAPRADTWVYDGLDWRQLQPASSPSPRVRHALAEDVLRGRVVLFGGAGAAVLGDTWEWDGTSWAQLAPAAAPPARLHHAMAYDHARARVVLHAGNDGRGRLADTWDFDGARWTSVAASSAPPPRQSQGLAFDLAARRLLAFGGEDGPTYRSDSLALATDSPASYHAYGAGCAGSSGVVTLAVDPYRLPWLGESVTVQASGIAPAASGVFMLTGFTDRSFGGLPLPLALGFAGMPGCRLHVGFVVSFPMTRSSPSTATWTVAMPATPAAVGVSFHNQAIVLEAGINAAGAVLSRAGVGTIGRR